MGGWNMQVEINKPDTIQFMIHLDQEDELYTSCMWARFTLDSKNWALMAQTDCGDYSYSWHQEENRTFMKFLTEINGDYLMRKVSSMSEFDIVASKENIILYLTDDDKYLEKEINKIPDFCDEREFMEELGEINGMEEYCDLYECIERDYPHSAKTFSRIFAECLQPELVKYLKSIDKQ